MKLLYISDWKIGLKIMKHISERQINKQIQNNQVEINSLVFVTNIRPSLSQFVNASKNDSI